MDEDKKEKKQCSMEGVAPPKEADAEEMPILGREQIIGAEDIKIQTVPVPEWGGTVCVRTISAGDWDDFENSLVEIVDGNKKKADLDDYRARFASIVICDTDGNKLFFKSDIDALTQKSKIGLDRVVEAGRELNGIADGDEEEIVENLKPTPDGDS